MRKIGERLPAAQAFIHAHALNEHFAGDLADIGIIVQGGLYNSVLRALARLGLADAHGARGVPLYVLNVVYPLVPEEVTRFCAGKTAVRVVEEGYPDYIEQQVNVLLRRADLQTRVLGKGALPDVGEYTGEVLLAGIASFLAEALPTGLVLSPVAAAAERVAALKRASAAALSQWSAP